MSVYIPVELQRKVRTHFSDRSAYCQTAEALTVAIFEIEHIIPRSAQGQTIFENLCLTCPTCNRYTLFLREQKRFLFNYDNLTRIEAISIRSYQT